MGASCRRHDVDVVRTREIFCASSASASPSVVAITGDLTVNGSPSGVSFSSTSVMYHTCSLFWASKCTRRWHHSVSCKGSLPGSHRSQQVRRLTSSVGDFRLPVSLTTPSIGVAAAVVAGPLVGTVAGSGKRELGRPCEPGLARATSCGIFGSGGVTPMRIDTKRKVELSCVWTFWIVETVRERSSCLVLKTVISPVSLVSKAWSSVRHGVVLEDVADDGVERPEDGVDGAERAAGPCNRAHCNWSPGCFLTISWSAALGCSVLGRGAEPLVRTQF